jgi:hypothetical protein
MCSCACVCVCVCAFVGINNKYYTIKTHGINIKKICFPIGNV